MIVTSFGTGELDVQALNIIYMYMYVKIYVYVSIYIYIMYIYIYIYIYIIPDQYYKNYYCTLL